MVGSVILIPSSVSRGATVGHVAIVVLVSVNTCLILPRVAASPRRAQAVVAYREGLERSPQRGDAWHNLGNLLGVRTQRRALHFIPDCVSFRNENACIQLSSLGHVFV